MQFDSINAFLHMGGYAFYVWLSYGVSAFFLVILVLSSKANHQKTINKIAQRQKRERKLRQAARLQNEKNTITSSEEGS
ncbi:MAG: heme exporter protein D [Alteromonadaceae bacterium]|jgi:heme exporter protein D